MCIALRLGSFPAFGGQPRAVEAVGDSARHAHAALRRHSGKVLVAMPEEFLPPVQPKFLTANRHLITGGLGGFVLPAPSTHDSLTILKAGGAV